MPINATTLHFTQSNGVSRTANSIEPFLSPPALPPPTRLNWCGVRPVPTPIEPHPPSWPNPIRRVRDTISEELFAKFVHSLTQYREKELGIDQLVEAVGECFDSGEVYLRWPICAGFNVEHIFFQSICGMKGSINR